MTDSGFGTDGRYGLMTVDRSVQLQQALLRRCRVSVNNNDVTHSCVCVDDRQGWILLLDPSRRKHPRIPGEPLTNLFQGDVVIEFVEWEHTR